jgi:CheY-like chemotaxis protein
MALATTACNHLLHQGRFWSQKRSPEKREPIFPPLISPGMDKQSFENLKPPIALVVDDEPLVLMDTADMISEEGYGVIEATSAAEAYEILLQFPSVELVLTDVQTGGAIDGLELAREVSRRWPQICVVVASGAMRPRSGDLPAGAVFLAKPLSSSLVHQVIKEHCQPAGEM